MITDDEPTPNLPLLRKVLDHIDAHPEEYQQASYAVFTDATTGVLLDSFDISLSQATDATVCKTAFCIAGHAVNMSVGTDISERGSDLGVRLSPKTGETWRVAGQAVLGLTEDEAVALFRGGNSRAQVQQAAEAIAARAGERL